MNINIPDHRDEPPGPLNNNNYRRQRYRVQWEENPEFRDWLQSVPGDENRA